MTAHSDAAAHLAKAREFLEAAEHTRELGLHNAATSSAVSSGINAKDTICLILTGRTRRSDNHSDAIAELRAAGRAGRDVASAFSRLLRLKPRSQYHAESISAADAGKAIEWATRVLDVAEQVAGDR